MAPSPTDQLPVLRRRDQQREQTRLDLALAAFALAAQHGLAEVRVPQVAAAVGVSPRTFNNYFPSKEAAIVWPATRRGAQLAAHLADRPADEPLSEALVATMASMYGSDDVDGLPPGWVRDLRALVAKEPALRGEYLKTADAVEAALADAIAQRTGAARGRFEAQLIAALVLGAERAAVRYWARQAEPEVGLVDLVCKAVTVAVQGTRTTP